MAAVNKVLVTGAGGLLGSEFRAIEEIAPPAGFKIITQTHRELDITSPESVENSLTQLKPDYLINCAAFTDVDRAESEGTKAREVNVLGLKILAENCLKLGIKLIHFSTDFVFDGEKRSPYVESDSPRPLNLYGSTKWEGEKILRSILPEDQFLILRISWPYGKNGKNFIHQLWELSKRR